MEEAPVTPYELATLASKICPDLCWDDPAGAIKVVRRLLSEAQVDLWEEKRKEKRREEQATIRCYDWAEGIRCITHEQRLDRALKRFMKFLKNPDGVGPWDRDWERELTILKREGFTDYDVSYLEQFYQEWSKEKPKPKKGKQGRRISKRDGRLRIGVMKLASQKTSKAA
jgi:hypothetical protein